MRAGRSVTQVRLAIIGAGHLGTALARRLLESGHEIVLGGGTSAQETAASLAVEAATNAEAAEQADVVVLAVPFDAVEAALADAQLAKGTIVWSCVNALKPDLTGLAIGFETSAAEEVARHAPRARVVSAIPPFAEALQNGDLRYDHGLAPSVFVCGDDDVAKRVVEQLVRDLGAQPVDAGRLEAARFVEPAMMLLIGIAYAGVPRDVGLRLLERTHTAPPLASTPHSERTPT
jgi:NADPH-dependent F420 reductase